jgi:molybdate transport system substrate-binding protein
MDTRLAKLTILGARSMHRVIGQLADDFTRETGHAVAATFGTVGAIQAKLDAGETADILISSAAAIERLARDGRLLTGSATAIARTSIGICVREGAPDPDIATPEAFRRVLAGTQRIAFSDAAVGGSAGVYLARLFEDLGLAATIRQTGMPQKSGVEVATRVAEGQADIGMTLVAEIMSVAGVRVAGPLPPPLGHDTTYAAAVSALCRAPEPARALIARCVDPANRDLWRTAGFFPPELV